MSRNAHGHFETWQLFLLDMQKLTLALQQIKVYHVHETTQNTPASFPIFVGTVARPRGAVQSFS